MVTVQTAAALTQNTLQLPQNMFFVRLLHFLDFEKYAKEKIPKVGNLQHSPWIFCLFGGVKVLISMRVNKNLTIQIMFGKSHYFSSVR